MSDSRELYRVGEQPTKKDRGTGWEMTRPNHLRDETFAIVSHSVFPLRIHHVKRETFPCMKENCRGCLVHNEKRWRGYLLALKAPHSQRCILELSAEVSYVLEDLVAQFVSLRGCMVLIGRNKPVNNAKHTMSFVKQMANPQILPPDQDCWPIICKIMGVEEELPPKKVVATLGETEQAEARRDAAGQLILRRNEPGELESLAESHEEREFLTSLIEKNLVNGNGRTGRK